VGQWDLYWLTGRQITRDGAKETARWTVASGGGQHKLVFSGSNGYSQAVAFIESCLRKLTANINIPEIYFNEGNINISAMPND
jgi:hypothetical protein